MLRATIRVAALTSFCLLLGPAGVALAQTVTRGPYLQTGTPTSVIVKWRTSAAADARVRYGTDLSNLSSFDDQTTITTNHEVTLGPLLPNTKYYYSIGTTALTLAGGDATHFFVTAPAEDTAKPTRVWILGDSGTANANAAAVRNAYQNFTGSRYTDVWLMLGDNAYNDGTDSEYQNAVFSMYPTFLRQTVLWPTLGNHDGHTADSATQTGPYYSIFTLPKQGEAGGMASGTEAYYSFDFGNIHFICLESYETNRSTNGAMLTWLRRDLEANTKPWVIAYWHHPPYSKGSHNSDAEIELIQMRENALPILEDFGVDLVLTGHSHSYERSFLIDGHYGNSGTFNSGMQIDDGSGRPDGTGAYRKPATAPTPNAGAVYAVAGSSGQTSGGPLNHPAMFISLNTLGSMVLDVNGGRLDALFLDSAGNRRDYFTIVKGGSNAPPEVSITRPTAGARFSVGATVVIEASASDADGTVSEVSVSRNGLLLGTDTTRPYSFTWTNVPGGTYLLTARATDDENAATNSTPVFVTVTVTGNAPPSVQITSPANGATFTAPATIAINATAADSDGSVALVRFRINGWPIAADTTGPYSYTLTNVQAGTYTLTARAFDNAGAVTTSSPISVTVNTVPGPVDPPIALPVRRVFDNKNGKAYYDGGPDGNAPMADLNTTTEEFKFEVEPGAGFWWETYHAVPGGTWSPSRAVLKLRMRPEESWSGTFVAEYYAGTTRLASINLPVNGAKDPITGKGTLTTFDWDLSSVVTTRSALANGRIRFVNTSPEGKKVWVTHSVLRVALP